MVEIKTGAGGTLLDALVARLIYRAVVVHDGGSECSYLMAEDRSRLAIPAFSTDPNQAQNLVTMLRQHGFTLTVKTDPSGAGVVTARGNGITSAPWTSDNPATAICLAAVDIWSRTHGSRT